MKDDVKNSENHLGSSEFRKLQHYAKEKIGIQLPAAKKQKICHSISKRMEIHNINTVEEYIKLLKENAAEDIFFTNSITNTNTNFFREKHHFTFLQSPFFAYWYNNKSELRIWSAGCATGEEPYSIVLALLEAYPDLNKDSIKVLATDINTTALEKAKQGIYAKDKIENITHYEKWFDLVSHDSLAQYKIHPDIQSMITFNQLNLLDPWPMKRGFDIIFFRNVSIHMTDEATQSILTNFDQILHEDGIIIIGFSESLLDLQSDYKFLGTGIYQKIKAHNNNDEKN